MKTSTNNSTYMMVRGETSNWMVPVCGSENGVFRLDLMDQTGCGGDLVRFQVEVRDGFKEVMFIGPHPSSFQELNRDTGLDLAPAAFSEQLFV